MPPDPPGLFIDSAALADAVNVLRSCVREHPGESYTSVVGAFEGVEFHLVAVSNPTHQHFGGHEPPKAPIRFE